jgi:beta-ureidopropionase
VVKPYTAVGLIPTVRGIRKREDIQINLEHLAHMCKAAAWLSSLDLPVRLIALPEGALQAFNDEVLDLDHVQYARECAIDIPGRETEALGALARQYNAFIMAQAKARHPDWKDRFFNVGFILDPRGEIILRHYKVSPLFPVEHSVCPHDIFDGEVRPDPGGILAGGGHGNRPSRSHDGQRGIVPRECPGARDERRGGGVSRIVSPSGHR